jgi:uncharacterized protein YjiS (DUF1127 family)
MTQLSNTELDLRVGAKAPDAPAGSASAGLQWPGAPKRTGSNHRPSEWSRRARVRRTVRELSRLDDEMLADVGIVRGEIRAVAEALSKGPIVEPRKEPALVRWFRAARRRLAQRRLARELAALDDHVLNDIGIQRSQIPMAALAAVSGNDPRSTAVPGDLPAAARQYKGTASTIAPAANVDRHDRARPAA